MENMDEANKQSLTDEKRECDKELKGIRRVTLNTKCELVLKCNVFATDNSGANIYSIQFIHRKSGEL